jgi:hypothetical protein
MQDFEASDGVAAINIDTTINATRMGSFVLVAPAQGSLGTQPLKAEDCKLFAVLKGNIDLEINHVYPRRCRVHCIRPASVATEINKAGGRIAATQGQIASRRLHLPMVR